MRVGALTGYMLLFPTAQLFYALAWRRQLEIFNLALSVGLLLQLRSGQVPLPKGFLESLAGGQAAVNWLEDRGYAFFAEGSLSFGKGA